METFTRPVKLTDVDYFKEPHRVIGLLSYAFSGAGTLCTIVFTTLPDWAKILAGVLYGILIGSAVIASMNRSVINYYLGIIEKLYKNGDIPSLQKESIDPYFEMVKRFYMESGITDIQKDTANYSEIVKRISEAKIDIKIIVYYGDRFLIQTKDLLIKTINRGVDVKLLIARKESDLLKDVWGLEGNEKSSRWDEAQKAINEIRTKTTDGAGTLTCHPYNTQARYALILVDGEWAWWTPYHSGIDVGGTSSFVLVDKGEKSIIRQCKEHFKKLWNKLEKEDKQNPVT